MEFSFFRGSTVKLKLSLRLAGSPVNISTDVSQIRFTCKRNLSDTFGQAVIAKYQGSGIETISATLGTARVTITPADTLTFDDATVPMFFDVRVTDSLSNKWTPVYGRCYCVANVSNTTG